MNLNKMKIIVLSALIIAAISSCGIKRPSPTNAVIQTTEYNNWSENLLKNLKAGKSVADIQKKLAEVKADDLDNGLPIDEQRKAFWMNVYNGYIIALLKNDKSLFDDRGAFFSKKQINIAG